MLKEGQEKGGKLQNKTLKRHQSHCVQHSTTTISQMMIFSATTITVKIMTMTHPEKEKNICWFCPVFKQKNVWQEHCYLSVCKEHCTGSKKEMVPLFLEQKQIAEILDRKSRNYLSRAQLLR